jgi:N-carbamoyl-D-amino-acid hydrolase
VRPRGLPGAGADHLLPALVHGGRGRARRFFEREMPGPDTAPLFDAAGEKGIGFYLGYAELTPEGTPLQHRRPGRQERARSSASTARSTCRATPSTSPGAPSSISRSATSRSATSAGASGAPWAGTWAWRSATTAAGPRPIACMGLQDVELVMLGYNTPRDNPPAPDHDRLSRVPQPARDAGRRLPERHLGRRRRQGGVEEGCEMIGGSSSSPPPARWSARR